jgi:hypothetical protein
VANDRLFWSPLAVCQYWPKLGTLQNMHQQPPQAPRSPNSRSMAGQSVGTIGRDTMSQSTMKVSQAPDIGAPFGGIWQQQAR